MSEKPRRALDDFVREQLEEMQSPFNQWVTGEEVGHEPSHNELAEHYIKHGGAAAFRKKWQERDNDKK